MIVSVTLQVVPLTKIAVILYHNFNNLIYYILFNFFTYFKYYLSTCKSYVISINKQVKTLIDS